MISKISDKVSANVNNFGKEISVKNQVMTLCKGAPTGCGYCKKSPSLSLFYLLNENKVEV
jgi:hypothetical protein